MNLRIGHGIDIHPLVEGRPLILGGISIPHEKGLEGHSDADAVIHAIIDAILGAAGKGVIGEYFPDTDPRLRGIDSKTLLEQTMAIVQPIEIVNMDITILAQKPKLQAYFQEMKKILAPLMNCTVSQLNIKATTTEKLGFVGREEGIEVHAVCLLKDVASC